MGRRIQNVILSEETVDLSVKPTKENTYEALKKAVDSENHNDYVKFWVKLRNLKVYFPAQYKLKLIHKDDYIDEEELLDLNLMQYTYPLQYLKGEHWVACFTDKEKAEELKPEGTHIFETRFLVLYLYYLGYVKKNYVDGMVVDPFNNDIVIDKYNMTHTFKLEMALIDYFNKNNINDIIE